MNARARDLPFDEPPATPMAYDPNNLHPDDEEDRKLDDDTLDIDWDDIIATTQDDVLAERYAFSTGDYPTHEEGMAALWKWMCTLGKGEPNEEAAASPPDAAGP
jgi:hypothetical protein